MQQNSSVFLVLAIIFLIVALLLLVDFDWLQTQLNEYIDEGINSQVRQIQSEHRAQRRY